MQGNFKLGVTNLKMKKANPKILGLELENTHCNLLMLKCRTMSDIRLGPWGLVSLTCT